MKKKNKKLISIEREEFKNLAEKLNDLKMKVWREELPFSMSKKKTEQIEFYIIEIQSLLQECSIKLKESEENF